MVLSPPVCNHQSINQVQRSISRCSISGLLLELCCLCTLSKDFCCSLLYLFKVRGDIFLVGQMRQLFSLISSCCCLSDALPSAPETWLYLDSRTRWSSWSTSWVDWRLWACSWKAATLCSSASSWTSMKRWLTLWHMQEYSSSSVIH